MLGFTARRRDARNWSPTREGRLLGFSCGGMDPNRPGGPDVPGGPERQPGAPRRDVDNQRNRNRDQVRDTVESREGQNALSARALDEKLDRTRNEMQGYLQKLEESRDRAEVIGRVEPAFLRDWQENERALRHGFDLIFGLKHLTQGLRRWEEGNMPPTELHQFLANDVHSSQLRRKLDPEHAQEAETAETQVLTELRRTIDETAGREAGDVTDQRLPDITNPTTWAGLNQNTRIQVIRQLSSGAAIQQKLEFCDAVLKHYEKALKDSNIKGLLDKEDKLKDLTGPEKQALVGSSPGILAALNVELMSAKQIGIGFSLVWKNWLKALSSDDNLKGARFARGVGRAFGWLYRMDDATRNIDQEVEAENRKAKNEYKEFLADSKMSFLEIFGNRGLLYINRGNSNRAMATLEYAASKGWLYSLAQQMNKAPEDIDVFGIRMGELFDPDMRERARKSFISGLSSDNQKGGQQEAQRLQDNEKHDNLDGYVLAAERELKNLNFWGFAGVIVAAKNKGVRGDAVPRMFTVFMRAFQSNPDLRRFITANMLNDIGSKMWNSYTFFTTMLSSDRNELMASAGETSMENYGKFTGPLMARLEATVRERGGNNLDQGTIDTVMARAIAGNVVEIGSSGEYVSIFEDRFTEFRNSPKLTGFTEGFDAGVVVKESNDYLAMESEILLHGGKVVDALIEGQSTGNFIQPSKAIEFLGQVVNYADKLEQAIRNCPSAAGRQALAGALRNFKSEMGGKIRYSLSRSFNHQPFRSQSTSHRITGDKLPLYGALVRYGLIDMDFVRTSSDASFIQAIERQSREVERLRERHGYRGGLRLYNGEGDGGEEENQRPQRRAA